MTTALSLLDRLNAVDSPEADVRIWSLRLDLLSNAESSALIELLDETERARAARFHFERDRHRYVVARAVLRELLGAELEISPAAISLAYGPHGKPRLAGHEALRFNLSHSAGWAVFAVTERRELGIDLESTNRLAPNDTHLASLAERILSERELEVWRALPEANRHSAFLRAWTRKEAFVKATGSGIFDGLRAIEVILDAAAPQPSLLLTPSAAAEAGPWQLHDLPAPEGFLAALSIAQA